MDIVRTLANVESHVSDFLFGAKLRYYGLHEASQIFTHMSPRERKQLFNLARQVPHNASALEIGSYLGASACFLAAGLRLIGGHLYCVDTWNNETLPEGERDTFPEFQSNTARYHDTITTIRKRSEYLTDGDVLTPLDLVFIDGDHSEPAVAKDVAITGPWIRPGGTLVFHDAAYFPSVARVIGATLVTGQWQLGGMVDNMLWLIRRDTDK